jgi:hypothetical protein
MLHLSDLVFIFQSDCSQNKATRHNADVQLLEIGNDGASSNHDKLTIGSNEFIFI